jgi:hypothetical protein
MLMLRTGAFSVGTTSLGMLHCRVQRSRPTLRVLRSSDLWSFTQIHMNGALASDFRAHLHNPADVAPSAASSRSGLPGTWGRFSTSSVE